MKSKMRTGIIAMTLFAALAIPVRLAAQEHNEKERAKPQRYTFVEACRFSLWAHPETATLRFAHFCGRTIT
jgi:hypothetical protein